MKWLNIELKFRFYKKSCKKERKFVSVQFCKINFAKFREIFIHFIFVKFHKISWKSLKMFTKCEIKILRNFAGHPSSTLGIKSWAFNSFTPLADFVMGIAISFKYSVARDPRWSIYFIFKEELYLQKFASNVIVLLRHLKYKNINCWTFLYIHIM